MEKITKDRVLELANLVRVAISDEEAETYANEINDVLISVDILNEVNTDQVKPMTHGIQLENVMRQDNPERTITAEEALSNAPEHANGQFKVPSIID